LNCGLLSAASCALLEEIWMLDQLSRWRFHLGVGRGISPIETAYYGVNPDHQVADGRGRH